MMSLDELALETVGKLGSPLGPLQVSQIDDEA